MAPQHLVAITATAMLLWAANESHAQPITVPAGLSPGDEYRLAFVTSARRDATSSNIADYNAHATAVASSQEALTDLGTTWWVIGSTSTVDARDNTNTNPEIEVGVPIYLLNDTLLVSDNADLWDGSLNVPLDINQRGDDVLDSDLVWTGSLNTGVAEGGVELGSSPGFIAVVGSTNVAVNGWIRQDFHGTSNMYYLYAVSATLTVPDPVPPQLPGLSGWVPVVLVASLLTAALRVGSLTPNA